MVPREVTGPVRRRTRVIQRRRQTFSRLLALSAFTLVAGFFPALRWIWILSLAVDGVLVAYVWRLLRWKRDEDAAIIHSQPVATRAPSVAGATAAATPAVIAASQPPLPHAEPAEVADLTADARMMTSTG